MRVFDSKENLLGYIDYFDGPMFRIAVHQSVVPLFTSTDPVEQTIPWFTVHKEDFCEFRYGGQSDSHSVGVVEDRDLKLATKFFQPSKEFKNRKRCNCIDCKIKRRLSNGQSTST